MGWGDELMVTGQARVLQESDPRKVRIVYERPRWHDVWANNPRIAREDEAGDFQELRPRVGYLRPYMAEKLRERWTWKPYRPPRGELYFDQAEIAFGAAHAGLVILEPHIKPGASPNKDWGWARWAKLTWLLQEKHGLRITQLGSGVNPLLDGAEHIGTKTMRLAAAVIARARAVVCHEGAFHHACAALGVDTPAVVIYGGYISPEVTGYDGQANFFSGNGLGCGMRLPCPHCRDSMAKIRPEQVAERLMEALNVPTPKYMAA